MEQIKWIFDLYDINRDGQIEMEEIEEILSAVQGLGVEQEDPEMLLTRFDEMDVNKDGMLTETEFVEGCLQDTALLKAIGLVSWSL